MDHGDGVPHFMKEGTARAFTVRAGAGDATPRTAPEAEAYFHAELTPGDYVLFCHVTAPGGRPHMEHGMILQVRVD